MPDVATSVRMPVQWLSRAEVLAKRLSDLPEFAAVLGSNPSRSAVLRLAVMRGLMELEALVSGDGYGPWFEVGAGVHARHRADGLWFVRVVQRDGAYEVSSNRRGVVFREGSERDLRTAQSRGDEVVRLLSEQGVYPSHLPSVPPPRPIQRQEVTLRIRQKAMQILADIEEPSEYVSGLVLRHEAEWRGAWRELLEAGWRRHEVAVAVALLREHALVNDMRGWKNHSLVPRVLGQGEPEAAQAGLDPGRWQDRATAALDDGVADQLLILAREAALGNSRTVTQLQAPVRLSWGRRGVGNVVMVAIDPDAAEKWDAKAAVDALFDSGDAPVFVEHGPYLLSDGGYQVALGLRTPDSDQQRVGRLVVECLGLPSAGWLS